MIIFILFVILIVFIVLIKNNEHFTNNDYNNFLETLNKYKRKKYIIIFTSGPSLTDFKKEDINKDLWENCYIIAVKNSINYLDKINIKPDFLVTNFIGTAETIDTNIIDKHKPLFIGVNYGNMSNLRKKTDYMINIDSKRNLMDNVKNNINDISFKNKNNKIITGWGHTMMESAIPLSLELQPKTIITVGWDIKNSNQYWHTETFVNWHDENTIINNFSIYLHKFLLEHYNIKIYKFSKKSAMKLPLFNIKSLNNLSKKK